MLELAVVNRRLDSRVNIFHIGTRPQKLSTYVCMLHIHLIGYLYVIRSPECECGRKYEKCLVPSRVRRNSTGICYLVRRLPVVVSTRSVGGNRAGSEWRGGCAHHHDNNIITHTYAINMSPCTPRLERKTIDMPDIYMRVRLAVSRLGDTSFLSTPLGSPG